ncbi:MAG: serine/threonine protein kinase [Planctomycetes bacterium]|nr:serine/threonine protein kinase [Planctomycetota bacterium]
MAASQSPRRPGSAAARSRSTPSHADLSNPRLTEAMEQYLVELEAGGTPDRRRYLAHYADIADELATCLDGLEFVHRIAPQLSAACEAVGDDGRGAPPARLAAAGTLGDYRILRELGRGGMGVVYEAEEISLRRRVALKVLPFAAVLDPRQLQRFKNEAMAAAQLKHPHIVSVYAVGCERGVHFYAMEYIEGQSLAELLAHLRIPQDGTSPTRARGEGPDVSSLALRAGASAPVDISPTRERGGEPDVSSHALRAGASAPVDISPMRERGSAPEISSLALRAGASASAYIAETLTAAGLSTDYSLSGAAHFRAVARLGREIAEALEHGHQIGVVHRDIKPANLLVDRQGRASVADFGLAQFDTDAGLTMTGDLVGTLRYMSPEQARGARRLVDHRTDVYSLGVTLYELLTLQPAFGGSNRQKLLRQVLDEEPPPPRQLNPAAPKDLETIVLKAIAKEPSDRYQTAQEVADDLGRYLEDMPIQARRPTFLERLVKWSRRHVRGLMIAFAVLSVMAVGFAIATALILREQGRTETARRGMERALANRRVGFAHQPEATGATLPTDGGREAPPTTDAVGEAHPTKTKMAGERVLAGRSAHRPGHPPDQRFAGPEDGSPIIQRGPSQWGDTTPMLLTSWLRTFATAIRPARAPRARRSSVRRPTAAAVAAEVLEDRTLLSTFVVTSTADTVDAGDGVTTLRETASRGAASCSP